MTCCKMVFRTSRKNSKVFKFNKVFAKLIVYTVNGREFGLKSFSCYCIRLYVTTSYLLHSEWQKKVSFVDGMEMWTKIFPFRDNANFINSILPLFISFALNKFTCARWKQSSSHYRSSHIPTNAQRLPIWLIKTKCEKFLFCKTTTPKFRIFNFMWIPTQICSILFEMYLLLRFRKCDPCYLS